MNPAVVGEKQQACGILVQPAHGIYPLGNINKVHDNLPAPVTAATDIAPGLVKHDVDHGLAWLNKTPGHFHLVGLRVDLNPQLRHDPAVDLNRSVLNMVFGFPSGADARMGNVFLESNHNKKLLFSY
jgi:hypothetical protein